MRNDVVQTPMCQFLSWQRGPPHIRNILYLPAWPALLLLYRPASHPHPSHKSCMYWPASDPPPPPHKSYTLLLAGVEPAPSLTRSLHPNHYTLQAPCKIDKTS